MRRREVLCALGVVAVMRPLVAGAQQTRARPLVGMLLPIPASTASRNVEAFRAGLRELGYVEGRDVTIELRFSDGIADRLPGLAAELVGLHPEVIVAGGPQAALAVRNASPAIPVVTNSSESPVVLGLSSNIARPDRNVTGFWWGDEGLIGKQLELLKEILPGITRIGIMVDPADRNATEPLRLLPSIAPALGVSANVIEVGAPSDFESAFATAARRNLQAVHVSITPLFIGNRAQLTAVAAKARLPVIYGIREFAEVGGLMSYGMSLPGLYREKARLVDKLLKGAKPFDVPIERPTKLELVINLRAAKLLGLKIPESFLVRADEVIE